MGPSHEELQNLNQPYIRREERSTAINISPFNWTHRAEKKGESKGGGNMKWHRSDVKEVGGQGRKTITRAAEYACDKRGLGPCFAKKTKWR